MPVLQDKGTIGPINFGLVRLGSLRTAGTILPCRFQKLPLQPDRFPKLYLETTSSVTLL